MRTTRGFTLIELMVTMIIIAILASMVMFAMFRAQQSAKEAKTKALITKLHNVISRRWEGYSTRRVPVSTLNLYPSLAADLKLKALRQIMRLEMPDIWRDIERPVLDITLSDNTTVVANPFPIPALTVAYQNYLDSVIDPSEPHPNKNQFQNAECLYMIVTVGLEEDGEGIKLFSDDEVGDVDGDGLKEFHDAWGMPISFIRWPAGFVDDPRQDGLVYNSATPPRLVSGSAPDHPFGHLSDLQPRKEPANATSPLAPCRCDQRAHHDPFDPRRVDPYAYVLFPLIYSAGPDKIFDIYAGQGIPADDDLSDPFAGLRAAIAAGTECDAYDPTVDVASMAGTPRDQTSFSEGAANGRLDHFDNIHNHLIDASLRQE